MTKAKFVFLRLEVVLSFIAVLSSVLVAVAFFGFFKDYGAGNPEDWGHFGDYFGGMLNPLIGIITVFLVVLTLRMTRGEARDTSEKLSIQIQLTKDQKILEDMYKRLDGLLSEWNRMLDLSCPPIMDGEHHIYEGGGTVRQYFDLPRLAGNLSGAVSAPSSRHTRTPLAGVRDFFQPYLALLEEMSVYCEEYDRVSGSKILGDFFRRRVRGPVRVLHAVRVVDDELWEELAVRDLSGDGRQRTGRPLR